MIITTLDAVMFVIAITIGLLARDMVRMANYKKTRAITWVRR